MWTRTRVWVTGHPDEQRLREEIEEHLLLQTEEFIRAGMKPDEARRRAVLKFGGVEGIKEAYREAAGWMWADNLWRDVRFAARELRNNPGFAAMAISILAIGLGASLAIFAFVDAALIRPLPYPNPTRLVDVTESIALFPRANLSYFDYLDWKQMNHVFKSLDIYTGSGELLQTPAGEEVVAGITAVSAGFFRTLGVEPIPGRDFHEGEDSPNAPLTAILTYGAWQKRFGGRDVIGKSVTLTDGPHTIIGVLPANFEFAPGGDTEFWIPFHPSSDKNSCEQRRSCHNLNGIARLKDGVTVAAALGEMKRIAHQLEEEYPDSNAGQGASILPLGEVIVGDIRPVLLTLLGGSGLLLVIACVNVACLLLVRSESRKRELNIRGALGASPARLVMQFVTEALVLVGAASVLGVFLAAKAIHVLMALLSKDMLVQMPFLMGLRLNAHAIAFAAAVSGLAVALFSATPLLRLPWGDFRSNLTEGSRGSARWTSFSGKMVVVELATAMVLLAGGGLLGKSLYKLLHVGLGFDSEHLAMVRVAAPPKRYRAEEAQVALAKRIVSSVSALPGVESAALASTPPVSFNGNTDWIRVVGRPYNGGHIEVNERDVSADFFRTLRAPLLSGRSFADAEDLSKPGVVIINEAFAKEYFPGENPIGQRIGSTDLSPKSIREIIGVVDDIREGTLDSEIMPAEYHPLNQDPGDDYSVIARTKQESETVPTEMTHAIRDIDPGIAAFGETTMTQKIRGSQTAHLHRSAAWLVGGFAVIALLLGVAGLYGMVTYSVGQRTREIGVRMALGAQQSTVHRMILREAAWLAGAGVVVGIMASIGAVSLMKNLLFGVSAWDIPTLSAVAMLLGLAALVASYVPARRAALVSPVEALRCE